MSAVLAALRRFLIDLYRSFPFQLLLLHLRRYQILLVFWLILASAINGDFLHLFGADALFLAPEYMGSVNILSTGITGMATGVFMMSWHITTFILQSRHFLFLATTRRPFLKYVINNSIIPLLFLIFYCVRAVQYEAGKELMPAGEIILLILGFLGGFLLITVVSFAYFFGAEHTIMRRLRPVIHEPNLSTTASDGTGGDHRHASGILTVERYLNTSLRFKRPRDISHYPVEFIDTVFKRHHFSAVISIIIAFLFLAMIGMLQDYAFFELPASAGILLLFTLLIAGAGAFVYWLGNWSIPVFFLLFGLVDLAIRKDLIDPRNKAYGIDYSKKSGRPVYARDSILSLCTPDKMETDRRHWISILEQWKAKQGVDRPLMYVVSVSGGGNRSATFTVNVLQRIDSILQGDFMRRTFLITGASGGMLGASFYRELFREKLDGKSVDLSHEGHRESIAKDLLNPLFSSMITRDLLAPAQKFQVAGQAYAKDRAYGFEERLNQNTGGILDHSLENYRSDEATARIPLMIFNSTVSADGRKMMISTQPISFMMRDRPDTINGIYRDPDAIDFCSFFRRQQPFQLRMLSVLRLNATFPFVLPNVWLPTEPVIDVMDAGIRDNYGQETMLRFLNVFEPWLKENTAGVVLVQVRDRSRSEWEEKQNNQGLTGLLTKPLGVVQLNWMKIQDTYQDEMVNMGIGGYSFPFRRLSFSYIPSDKSRAAALNFHLTNREKIDIHESLYAPENARLFRQLAALSAAASGQSTEGALPIDPGGHR